LNVLFVNREILLETYIKHLNPCAAGAISCEKGFYQGISGLERDFTAEVNDSNFYIVASFGDLHLSAIT
jgi:hypothetical protein